MIWRSCHEAPPKADPCHSRSRTCPAGLVFVNGAKVVRSTQKEQLGDLLDQIAGIGNAVGTGGILVGVGFASQLAGEHVLVLSDARCRVISGSALSPDRAWAARP